MRNANRGFGSHSLHKNSFYIILQGFFRVKRKIPKKSMFCKVFRAFPRGFFELVFKRFSGAETRGNTGFLNKNLQKSHKNRYIAELDKEVPFFYTFVKGEMSPSIIFIGGY